MKPAQPLPINTGDTFPVIIDNSILNNTDCLRRYFHTAHLGHKIPNKLPMYYGNCGHKYLEWWHDRPDKRDMASEDERKQERHRELKYMQDLKSTFIKEFPDLESPMNYFKHLTGRHFIEVMNMYMNTYPKHKDPLPVARHPETGKASIEWQFLAPYEKRDKVTLMLAGTIDAICYPTLDNPYEDIYDKFVIKDLKFTTNKYVDSFLKKLPMSTQFKFYSLMLRELWGLNYYPPVVVDVVFLRQGTKENIKKGIWDLARFERSRAMSYTDEEMEDFQMWLKAKLEILLQANLELAILNQPEKTFPMNYNRCTDFGGCPLLDQCALNRESRETVLTNATRKLYDPREHRA